MMIYQWVLERCLLGRYPFPGDREVKLSTSTTRCIHGSRHRHLFRDLVRILDVSEGSWKACNVQERMAERC